MRKKTMQIAALALCAALVFTAAVFPAPTASAAGTGEGQIVRVGLYFGDSAVSSRSLTNIDGSGFRFGYYDGDYDFMEQGSTTETSITVVTNSSSSRGVMVLITGTDTVLFQSDGALAVQPGQDDSAVTLTACGGYRYYGGFQFERRTDGGSMTVVNFVHLEDYVKGVLPYEVSASWPIEALKAQAVCARTYAMTHLGNRETSTGCDLFNTTSDQVYKGAGSATANSDSAVDQTVGQYVWYDGKMAQTYFYSCDGGATENSEDVWGNTVAYLRGKADPYEAAAAGEMSYYTWTTTYTAEELTAQVQKYGLASGTTVADVAVTKTTDNGQALEVTLTYANGGTATITKERCRTVLGLRSQNYTVARTGAYHTTDGDILTGLSGLLALFGGAQQATLDSGSVYAITGSGTESLDGDGVTFTFTGGGWGHGIGLSQWGAYAMAKYYDKNYIDILTFYYTGVTVGTTG